jgi:hydrogenase nickel incorporation protein HypA/HybF
MHEMAMVKNALEMVCSEALRRGASRVTKIKLRIGEFRGVVKESFEFAYKSLRRDTLAADAELEIETVPLRVECERCGQVECSAGDFDFLCPRCGDPAHIVAGREMEIEYLEIE